MKALLDIEDLHVSYGGIDILKNFNIGVQPSEILGIVGESGCGKSTLIRALIGLMGPAGIIEEGKIYFDGMDLLSKNQEEMRQLRGKEITVIFQNPEASLNPTRKILDQFIETIRSHEKITRKEAYTNILDLLDKLDFNNGEEILKSYPFQLSGGMNQRVAMALAMIMKPKLLLADEPTSALDVTVQAQVIDEMMRLRDTFGTSIILVTHSMGVIARMADKIGVMYAGQVVEYGYKKDVLNNPMHPYTKALINAIPGLNTELPEGIEGRPPSFGEKYQGCSFAARCSICREKCLSNQPHMMEVQKEHWTRCRVMAKSKVVLT